MNILTLVGASCAGWLIGVATGLAPGIHVNTLLPFLVLLPVPGEMGAAVIFSVAITHIFLDFIPSTVFGVPDSDTALVVLPAHRLLLAGRGYEAIKLTVIGSLGAFAVSCLAVFPMIRILPLLYRNLSPFLGYILLLFVFFIIVSEKSPRKIFFSCVVFLISGVYGCIVLSSPLVSEDAVLFPVFCGLFGLSTLSLSMKGRTELPEQIIDSKIHLSWYETVSSILKGVTAGIFVSLFPGVGPAHATAVLSVRSSPRQFLVAVSGVNTANCVYALIGLYTFGKARSGVVVALEKLVHIDGKILFTLLSCGLLAAGLASVTALYLARKILEWVPRVNYTYLAGSTCTVLAVSVGIVTGVPGLLILAVGVCIGILPPLLGVRRTHLMGVLLLPILLYYIGFFT